MTVLIQGPHRTVSPEITRAALATKHGKESIFSPADFVAGEVLRRTALRLSQSTQRHKHFAHSVILLERVAQRNIAMDFITIASAFLYAGDIPSIDKVTNDGLGRALGNTDEFSHISGSEVRIASETDHDMAVISEKSPLRLV
jgi:hypothetical protein